jgi:hypothetical protein
MLLIGLLAFAGSVAPAAFAYLRYRAYLRLVRHIADSRGLAGLRAIDNIAKPEPGPNTRPSLRRRTTK